MNGLAGSQPRRSLLFQQPDRNDHASAATNYLMPTHQRNRGGLDGGPR